MRQVDTTFNGKRLVQNFYDDWYDAIDIAMNEARIRELGGWLEADCLQSRMGLVEMWWDNDHTFEDVKRMLLADGWPEGVANCKTIVDEIFGEVSNKMIVQEAHYDVSGSSIDIGAFMTGQPECCLNFYDAERSGAGKVISVITNITASAGINAHKMFVRGAATVALLDLLEASGYRVELIVAEASGYVNVALEYLIPAKSACESVSRDRLVFALCHPAMLRRINFSHCETISNEIREQMSGSCVPYGYPSELSMQGYTADISIPSAQSNNFMSTSSAKAWVIAELKKQGIEVKEKAA